MNNVDTAGPHPSLQTPPSPLRPQPHGSAAAVEGALQHAAARLPTALSPTASAPLARLENSTPDVAAGALLGANA